MTERDELVLLGIAVARFRELVADIKAHWMRESIRIQAARQTFDMSRCWRVTCRRCPRPGRVALTDTREQAQQAAMAHLARHEGRDRVDALRERLAGAWDERVTDG